MKISKNISLKTYHTFGIDVKASILAEYNTTEELMEVLNSEEYKSNKSFHIGSGSNLLFTEDYNGMILHSKIQYIRTISENNEYVLLEAGSGVVWDDFVAYCVDNDYYGAENLSLIPGEVGASAVQNIGAYGTEVKDLIQEVKAIEIATGKSYTFSNEECGYGYRDSIFKKSLKGKYIVTSVVFRLSRIPVFHLGYQHLEDEVKKRGDINLRNIRETIIEVRNSKLPDPAVRGNAGSFFMNPVVPKALFQSLQVKYPEMPHYFVSETEEKIPAGWLIEKCGWKGKSVGEAAVHDKQALVLVNNGNATGNDIVHLATEIQKSVYDTFSIRLQPEVIYIPS